MGNLEIFLLTTLPLIALILVPNLAFGTHEDYLWEETYLLQPWKEGDPWIKKLTYMEPIAKKSPECLKKNGAASPECQDASLYQITIMEDWDIVENARVIKKCQKYTTEEKNMKRIDETQENSFSRKIGNTMRHEATHTASVGIESTTTVGAKAEFGGIGGYAEQKTTVNANYEYQDKTARERSEEIQNQMKVSYSVVTENQVTTTDEYDLDGAKMQYIPLQKFMTVKYDLWTPVTNIQDNIDETKVMLKNLNYQIDPIQDVPEVEYSGAHYFKAHDLPGDQYYIHTSYVQKYPTNEEFQRDERTAWDCDRDIRIKYDHTNPPESLKGLNVILRPTKHHANIVVIDNEYKPVSGATVKLGIPSFPLNPSQPDACTSVGSSTLTDQYGSAYFYLGDKGPADTYVFDGIHENSKPDGLVAMFPGNGDFKDLVFPDRVEDDMVIQSRMPKATDASFKDGIVGEAFSFTGNHQGLQFTDLSGLDLTKAVTISAWIKPKWEEDDANWQAIAVKSTIQGGGHDRNFGLWVDVSRQLIQISYFNPNNINIHLNSPQGLIVNNVWHHILGIIDTENNFMEIYLNGELVASKEGPIPAMLPVSDTFSIGIEIANGNSYRPFHGLIDEVAIYEKALSESDRQKIRDTTVKSSPCQPGEVSSDQFLEVIPPSSIEYADYKPISRDLAFDEQHDVWYVLSGAADVDNEPPILVVPKTKIVEATSESGANVDYTATAYDAVDKELIPGCNPPSGAEFLIGQTEVNCSVQDSSGNIVSESFNVIVTAGDVVIPVWIKDVAGLWCEDEIDSTGFVQVIQWMIDNNLIIIPQEEASQESSTTSSSTIPDWIQFNACIWYEGTIDDKTFANAIQWLIDNGIIEL